MPLFSIITVTYNARSTLAATLQSVLDQPFTDFEYLVIDGGSTDGTAELLHQYAPQLATLLIEPDRGIYDAMNKGIDRAKGDYLYFLGADDQLVPGVLPAVAKALSNRPDLLYGDIQFTDGRRFTSTFSWKTWLNNTVHHQGAFYHRALFDSFRYDVAARIMSDYELNLLVYRNRHLTTRRFDGVVARCTPNGASASTRLSWQELNTLRSRHFPPGIRQVLAGLTRLKYFLHYDVLRKI